MSAPLGTFVWYELMTTDPAAARDFYGPLVGWDAAVHEDGEIPYTMWMRGEVPAGGLMELPRDARAGNVPPHWMAYIATPDMEETTRKAEDLGATLLHGPQEIPGMGTLSVLQDPQGAVFSLWESASESEEPGPETPSLHGHFSWNELLTTDHEGAFDFYATLFGWVKTDAMDMGPMGTYQMYGHQDRTYGGMYNKPEEVQAPPHWLYYVMVDDVDSAARAVKELGGQVLHGPMEVPGGDRVAQCMDPQGAVFALHSKG